MMIIKIFSYFTLILMKITIEGYPCVKLPIKSSFHWYFLWMKNDCKCRETHSSIRIIPSRLHGTLTELNGIEQPNVKPKFAIRNLDGSHKIQMRCKTHKNVHCQSFHSLHWLSTANRYRLEDPRGWRSGKSPYASPRGSVSAEVSMIAQRLLRRDIRERSYSDDTQTHSESGSPEPYFLHPDHAWQANSRRGSSQSEQLEIEPYELNKDYSRSLPGSRRSSFQSQGGTDSKRKLYLHFFQ